MTDLISWGSHSYRATYMYASSLLLLLGLLSTFNYVVYTFACQPSETKEVHTNMLSFSGYQLWALHIQTKAKAEIWNEK